MVLSCRIGFHVLIDERVSADNLAGATLCCIGINRFVFIVKLARRFLVVRNVIVLSLKISYT